MPIRGVFENSVPPPLLDRGASDLPIPGILKPDEVLDKCYESHQSKNNSHEINQKGRHSGTRIQCRRQYIYKRVRVIWEGKIDGGHTIILSPEGEISSTKHILRQEADDYPRDVVHSARRWNEADASEHNTSDRMSGKK